MLTLTCPFCGKREHIEFEYGGPAGLSRPWQGAEEQAWLDYLYQRDNPADWRVELWRHAHGCGIWFEVERHTTTHEIRPREGAR